VGYACANCAVTLFLTCAAAELNDVECIRSGRALTALPSLLSCISRELGQAHLSTAADRVAYHLADPQLQASLLGQGSYASLLLLLPPHPSACSDPHLL
jgi:hypothetical protein